MESKKYKISVKRHNKGSDGHVEYEITFENETDGISFAVLKRYSELKTLNDLLRKETPSSLFPKFPPKKFFGSREEEFINKRQQEINLYFNTLSTNEEFAKLPSLLKFIEENKKNAVPIERSTNKNSQKKREKKIYFKKIKNINNTYLFIGNERDLTSEEKKNLDEKNKRIIENCKIKYIPIDYQPDQDINQHIEPKFLKVFKDEKIFNNNSDNNEIIFSSIEAGNDDNFNLIGNNDNNNIEDNIRQKIDEISKKIDDLSNLYNVDEIVEKF